MEVTGEDADITRNGEVTPLGQRRPSNVKQFLVLVA